MFYRMCSKQQIIIESITACCKQIEQIQHAAMLIIHHLLAMYEQHSSMRCAKWKA